MINDHMHLQAKEVAPFAGYFAPKRLISIDSAVTNAVVVAHCNGKRIHTKQKLAARSFPQVGQPIKQVFEVGLQQVQPAIELAATEPSFDVAIVEHMVQSTFEVGIKVPGGDQGNGHNLPIAEGAITAFAVPLALEPIVGDAVYSRNSRSIGRSY